MSTELSRYQGCLLGLAVGDAMGYTVDGKSWDQICQNYGPNGLLGYDLANGCAEVSSYTQIAAYVANGLLIGITRGQKEHYMRFVRQTMREWARSQMFYRDPEAALCWVSKLPAFRRRNLMDSRMLDTLRAKTLGTPAEPINQNTAPGAITAAVAVGLSFDPKRMDPSFLGAMSAQTIALTHGCPEAFLSGVVLAYAIAGVVHEPELDFKPQFTHAVGAMQAQYVRAFPQAESLGQMLLQVIGSADPHEDTRAALENMHCDSADQCLAGAMYTCLVCPEDFDAAMILAVNHSGRSAAVGAMAGAILGAKLGYDTLPDFYLESLEVLPILLELAEDLSMGSPTMGLFDDDWDHKYTQGLPPVAETPDSSGGFA